MITGKQYQSNQNQLLTRTATPMHAANSMTSRPKHIPHTFDRVPSILLVLTIVANCCDAQQSRNYPIRPVVVTERHVHDSFWTPRLRTNRTVSIPHNFEQCKRTGRIDAFLHAAKGTESEKKGPSWWDSDVYKVIEGASYCLADHPNPQLTNYVDLLISVIAAAQDPDGYLHTFRTINPRHAWNGPRRFSHPISHEFFNAGHLYEAAIAHHRATGRRNLLDIANKNAALILKTFGGKPFGIGGADMLILPDHPQFDFGSKDFSVQLWFKPHAASRMGLFSGATDYWFGLDFHNQGQRNVCLWASSGGKGWDLIHSDAGGAGIGKIPLELNQWHHIVVVRKGDRWRTYINNQIDVDITAAGTIVDKDEHKQIGMWADVGNWINGTVDELAIFNVALTAKQVDHFYRNQVQAKASQPQAPRPTGLWQMDDGNGTIVRDASANANHGKIHGAEWLASGAVTYSGNRSLDFVGDRSHYKPDHPEIELALVKLYQLTGRDNYLDLAKYLSDHKLAAWRYPKNAKQFEAKEHIVGSTYAWCGMTDLVALEKAPAYRKVIDSLWDSVVSRKLYLTGGIGARGEHFDSDYVLPNSGLEASPPPSVETCGAIALAMWNQRLFRMYGDARYVDVLERTLYNALPSSVSLAGDAFTYANPLTHDGKFNFNMGFPNRQPFLSSACCPTNTVRFLPQIPSLIYAQGTDDMYVNLFIDSEATFEIAGTKVRVRQQTNYPWNGRVELHITPERPVEFPLRVRIPGWSRNQPVPSQLYRYVQGRTEGASLTVNKAPLKIAPKKGYAVIQRAWKKGDSVTLNLPMPIRRVLCHENVTSNRGKVALERGPLVYCAEGADNGPVLGTTLADEAKLRSAFRPNLLQGVEVIEAEYQDQKLTLIPYAYWLNRGQNEMTVWFSRKTTP